MITLFCTSSLHSVPPKSPSSNSLLFPHFHINSLFILIIITYIHTYICNKVKHGRSFHILAFSSGFFFSLLYKSFTFLVIFFSKIFLKLLWMEFMHRKYTVFYVHFSSTRWVCLSVVELFWVFSIFYV